MIRLDLIKTIVKSNDGQKQKRTNIVSSLLSWDPYIETNHVAAGQIKHLEIGRKWQLWCPYYPWMCSLDGDHGHAAAPIRIALRP